MRAAVRDGRGHRAGRNSGEEAGRLPERMRAPEPRSQELQQIPSEKKKKKGKPRLSVVRIENSKGEKDQGLEPDSEWLPAGMWCQEPEALCLPRRAHVWPLLFRGSLSGHVSVKSWWVFLSHPPLWGWVFQCHFYRMTSGAVGPVSGPQVRPRVSGELSTSQNWTFGKEESRRHGVHGHRRKGLLVPPVAGLQGCRGP